MKFKNIFFSVVFIGIFGAAESSQAATCTHYVSPTGSATWANATNINSPSSAIIAFANAVAGNVVCFRGGTYVQTTNSIPYYAVWMPSNSGTPGHSVTFQAYPGETPFIRGWTPTRITGTATGGDAYNLIDSNSNFLGHGINNYDIVKNLTTGAVSAVDDNSNSGNVTTHAVALLGATCYGPPNYCTNYPLSGGTRNTFQAGDQYEIFLASTNVMGNGLQNYITFDGFRIKAVASDNPSKQRMAGMMVYGRTQPMDGNPSIGVTIKNCDIDGGPVVGTVDNLQGIRIDQSSYVSILNNKIYNFRDANDYHNTSGTKSYHNTHITYQNNEFYNCSNALFDKSGSDYDVISNNYIHDSKSSIEITTNIYFHNNGVISNNLITNFNGACIGLGASDDVVNNWQIYNNTCYTTQTSEEGALATADAYNSTGWSFYNNISQAIGSDYGGAVVRYASTATATLIDYNNYGSNFNVLCGSNYSTLSSLKTATCSHLTSGNHDQHSIAGAPIFTNSSGSLKLVLDYTLASNSPGYHAGNDGKDMGADISLVGPNPGRTPVALPAAPMGLLVN